MPVALERLDLLVWPEAELDVFPNIVYTCKQNGRRVSKRLSSMKLSQVCRAMSDICKDVLRLHLCLNFGEKLHPAAFYGRCLDLRRPHLTQRSLCDSGIRG